MISVLIVEDDPMVAELNKNYLMMMNGFRLAGTAANGKDALAFLRRHTVSLLLLDVFMPHMDGLSLLRDVHKQFPTVDVIMLTAARNSEDIQKALRLGVIDYIVKPFVFARFQSALLAYRERLRLLASPHQISQEALDRRIFSKDPQESPLPKGIDAQTLAGVRQQVFTYGQDFSIKGLVPHTGISRVSLKKYLDYMQESGEVTSYLIYPPLGRPVRLYRVARPAQR